MQRKGLIPWSSGVGSLRQTDKSYEGVYSADSESRLRHELEEKGLFVLSLQPKGAIGGFSFQLPQSQRIAEQQFLVFNQELATLLKAGMPLVQSLDLLKRRVESPVFRTVLDDVHEKVRSGTALSDAFAAHSDRFPRVYTASLLAGERSGNLDAVLRRYVEYAKIISTVKRKTRSALAYPAILIVLSLALCHDDRSEGRAGVRGFLRVVWRSSCRSSHASSWRSRAFLRSQFLLVAVVLVVGVISFVVWVKQPGQQARLDRLILRTPFIGPIAAKFATSQMARTLATLLGGGLPLVNALEIVAKSVGNQYMAAQLGIVNARVKEGESFAAALEARHVFPDVAVKMAEVGESTGALQDMLNTVADFYDEEIATNLERFVTLVEPTLLVVMGIVIAGLLLALYMPLFQLSSVLT